MNKNDERKPWVAEQANAQERFDQNQSRREFVRKASLAGLSAGFAHFLLVGGRLKKALAQTDLCETGQDLSSSTDECNESNEDSCIYVDGSGGTIKDKVDFCNPEYSPDLCKVYADNNQYLRETNDVCGQAPNSDTTDHCEAQFVPSEGFHETGDYCPEDTGTQSEDECIAYRYDGTNYESDDVCPDGLNDDISRWPQGGDSCGTLIMGGSYEIGDSCPAQHASDEDYDFCNRNYAGYDDVA
ncbi:MAG: hypothetical protein ACOX5J_04195 [Candidatus Hydrogenedentales bacterium]|jgi:hypothetical protein